MPGSRPFVYTSNMGLISKNALIFFDRGLPSNFGYEGPLQLVFILCLRVQGKFRVFGFWVKGFRALLFGNLSAAHAMCGNASGGCLLPVSCHTSISKARAKKSPSTCKRPHEELPSCIHDSRFIRKVHLQILPKLPPRA